MTTDLTFSDMHFVNMDFTYLPVHKSKAAEKAYLLKEAAIFGKMAVAESGRAIEINADNAYIAEHVALSARKAARLAVAAKPSLGR